MRDLILQTLRESVKAYPELKGYLSDEALILSWVKVGEAPDDEQRRKDERRLQRALVDFFSGQFNRIMKEIRKDFNGKSVFQMSFWDSEQMMLWEAMGGTFINIILHGVDGAVEQLPEWGRDILNIDAVQFDIVEEVTKYRQEWVDKIGETTMKQVWKEIEAWQQTGDPLPTLINTLKEKEEFMFGKKRAERIAVTETTRLHAIGNQVAFKKTGYIDQWNWMTAQDELVCPVCRAGNKNSPYPISELHNKLPAHPNCRCWSQPIVNTDRLNQMTENLWEGVNFG
jgi:SPP1 gp7 family putative phage head morphogenesis protein